MNNNHSTAFSLKSALPRLAIRAIIGCGLILLAYPINLIYVATAGDDLQQWNHPSFFDRKKIADDWIANQRLIGQNRDSIIESLGKPGGDRFGQNSLVWYIRSVPNGGATIFHTDDEFLEIVFDQNGTATEVRIFRSLN